MKLADIEIGEEYRLDRPSWRSSAHERGRVTGIEVRQVRIGYTSVKQNRRMVLVQQLDGVGNDVGPIIEIESRQVVELWAPYVEERDRKRNERQARDDAEHAAIDALEAAMRLLGFMPAQGHVSPFEVDAPVRVGRDSFSSADRVRVSLNHGDAQRLLDRVRELREHTPTVTWERADVPEEADDE
jgi:hypothetical protein